mgnify:CR=1 FL=1
MRTKSLFFAVGALAFITGAIIFSAPSAHAQWYVSGNAGASFLQDASVTDTFAGGSGTGDVSFDTGYGLSGAIGHAWGPFRLEGELSYRKNDLDQIDVTSVTIAGLGTISGALGTFSLMVT